MEREISKLYNFNYKLIYHRQSHKNEEEKKTQHKYDLLQIISESDNDDLYHIKLYGIFIILNSNKDTKQIINLLRKKMPEEYHDETDFYHNVKLFNQILSYDFLHLYHPCICDIYHNNIIKTENLNKLLTFLENIKCDTL
jgi:hypothetical protein